MAKHWIKAAIKHPGALKAAAKAAGESTREFAEAHEHDSGKTGSRSRLALTLMGMHHGSDHKPEAEVASRLYGKKRVRSG
ncbi:MAG TPA: hypothetical protein VNU19_24205 [Candidatus Acidoferrum sp.]|jgi:hypothetical protein|nr:hypothetical protein [Candidatus Acidoferrum sp.]